MIRKQFKKMRQITEQQSQFKVAPVISDEALAALLAKAFKTILGLPPILCSLNLLLYFLLPCIVIIPALVLPQNLYLLAILLPTVLLPLIVLVVNICRSESMYVSRYIMCAIFGVLWANHLYVVRDDVALVLLSCIAVLLSCGSVAIAAVQQFQSTTTNHDTPAVDSSLYVRLMVGVPTLVVELMLEVTGTEFVFGDGVEVGTSLVWICWVLGWVGTIRDTFLFLLNAVNSLLFGHERHIQFFPAFLILILSIATIAIYRPFTHFTHANTYLLAMSTFNALIISVFLLCASSVFHSARSIFYLAVAVQLIILAIMIVLNYTVDFTTVNPSVWLGIDVGLYAMYLLLREMGRARSKLGCLCGCYGSSGVQVLWRWVLRASSCLVFVGLQSYLLSIQLWEHISWSRLSTEYVLIPLLLYRSYSRCLSDPRAFSLHGCFLVSLILYQYPQFQVLSVSLLYFMPMLPPNMLGVLWTPFSIPPKLQHSNESCYKVFYFITSLFAALLYFLTLGIFQLKMLGGLPIYCCVMPTQTLGTTTTNTEQSLYEKIVGELEPRVFRGLKKGFYLLRMGKYILLVQVASEGFGWFQVVNFKGLQVQQVTTCHTKQAQTMDSISEQTWGENRVCCDCMPHLTVVWPEQQHQTTVSGENEIKLTGIIENEQFFSLFKDGLIKCLMFEYAQIQLTPQQKEQAEVMAGELGALMTKEKVDSIFPYSFGKQLKIPFGYPTIVGRKKLPPLPHSKQKKQNIIDDFAELLEGDSSNLNLKPQKGKKEDIIQTSQQTLITSKQDEMNLAVVMTCFHYVVRKKNFLDAEKVYKILKRDHEVLTELHLDGGKDMVVRAIGCALKVCVGKFLQDDLEVTLTDIEQYVAGEFLGVVDSAEFAQALAQNKEDIWTVNYQHRSLQVKRLAKVEITSYLFSVDQVLLNAIWNNQRSELFYVGNDNDERYSIQTHGKLLRNLFTEGCEQPFGYPGYDSGWIVNI